MIQGESGMSFIIAKRKHVFQQSAATHDFSAEAIHRTSHAILRRGVVTDKGAAVLKGRFRCRGTSSDDVHRNCQRSVELAVWDRSLCPAKEKQPHITAGYFASTTRVCVALKFKADSEDKPGQGTRCSTE